MNVLPVALNVSILQLKNFVKKWRLKLLPVLFKGFKSFGFCNVCGNTSKFLTWGSNSASNGLSCVKCCSIARYRLIGLILANYFDLNLRDGFPAKNFEKSFNMRLSLNSVNLHKDYKVLDTSYNSYLASALKGKTQLYMSEYLPALEKGKKLFGVMHQDLTGLSFSDEYLNCIITSDVFEHIDKPWVAFREVWRTLKPGGIHVFTVPIHDHPVTVSRAVFENRKIKHLENERYHKNPLSLKGSLVFTDFGTDLIERLNEIGFVTEKVSLAAPKNGFMDTEAFISIKR